MRNLLKDKTGSVPVLTFGFVFLLLLLTFLTVEMGSTFENYDYCMDVLQRSCNSAVEANIDDTYRADKVLILDAAGAEADFYSFVSSDLTDRYHLTVSSITCTETAPSMTVIGTVTFNTIFAQYGWDDLTFSFKVRATNYDLE